MLNITEVGVLGSFVEAVGKMNVALVEVYADVVQHLDDLFLRDGNNTAKKVFVGVPEEAVIVKHNRYGRLFQGQNSSINTEKKKISTRQFHPHEVGLPECDHGALVTKLHTKKRVKP